MERTFFSPQDVNKFFHESYQIHQQGDLEEAEQRYNGLLNIDIDNPTLLFLLGTLYMQQNKNGLAINLLSRVIEKKPDMGEAYVNRGCCYRREFLHAPALSDFKKAIELLGDSAFVYSNMGSLSVNSGEPGAGMEYADKALQLDPDNAQAHWNRALLLLEQGQFREGFEEYEYGKKSGDRLVRNYTQGGDTPWWDGTPGQHVVVYGEQGLGDEILFSSCLPELINKCEKVYFETNPRLATLFQRSFPGTEVYGTRKQDHIEWAATKRIDARIALGDLPRFFRRSLADFPKHQGYLQSDHDLGFDFRMRLAKLGPRPKVGLAWAGGIKRTNVDQRSLNLFLLLPILTQDVEWVSLQYTDNAETHIEKFEKETGIKVHHWTEDVVGRDNYDSVAALVDELDLVVTVNTSVAHLAGALDVPTWVLTPKAKAWRYWSPDGLTSPWYPRWRLYQQDSDWVPVIDAVAHDLAHWIAKRKAA